MRKHNGKQLYGIQKILTTLKMGMNKELKELSIKQKSGPLNREGFIADAVAGAFAKHPPRKLFRHIHQGVLLLNADFAQRTTGDVGNVG